jgi:ribosomal protein S18
VSLFHQNCSSFFTFTSVGLGARDHILKQTEFKGFRQGSVLLIFLFLLHQLTILYLQFIRPHQLTYQSRLSRERPKFTRPLVGPSRVIACKTDPFHLLNLDPVRECMNHQLLTTFVTKMGRILNRRETGLTMKNQRRLGKAIRRAKMMGIIPVLSSAWTRPSSTSHTLSKRQQNSH